jgi:hypothetical protein
MPVPKLALERIFGDLYPEGTKTTTLNQSNAHSLAVMFMVLLLGTFYELNLEEPSVSAQTERFHSLARAAMAADPVTENTTVQGVQAIVGSMGLERFKKILSRCRCS